MSQLTIIAQIIAKAGKTEFVKQELNKLIAPTRSEEGCIDYILHQDNENENLFLFYENWTSYELWQQHLNSTHIKENTITIKDSIKDTIINQMTPAQ